jgi:hypothetical protein
MRKPVLILIAAMAGTAILGSGSTAVAQPKSPPQVTAVNPYSNAPLAKGNSLLMTLVGTNFIYVSSVEAVQADAAPVKVAEYSPLKRPAPGVKVTLTGVRTPTTLGVQIDAPFSAPDGLYFLRLRAGGESFDVPQEIFKLRVFWGRPQILDCIPRQAPIGTVITLRGNYFGDPTQPEKTQFLAWVRRAGELAHQAPAEIVSLSPKEAQVRVPDLAVYARWDCVTPGGRAWEFPVIDFDPLYIRTFPPDLFQPEGALGFLHFSQSQFIFADGPQNSVFLPSSDMRAAGFPEIFAFTFPPYEKFVNLVIGSTKIRVRLNGTNRRSRAESLQSTSLSMTIDGTTLKVEARFESDGVEFFGEYETQDILSKKITWHRFQDVNIDNLSLTAVLTPTFFTADDIRIQSVTASSSFVPGFVILDQNISVDNTPIKDYIKAELEASLKNYLMSDAFRGAFLPIFGRQVQTLFQGCPRLNVIEVGRSDDGGMKLTGSTRPAR